MDKGYNQMAIALKKAGIVHEERRPSNFKKPSNNNVTSIITEQMKYAQSEKDEEEQCVVLSEPSEEKLYSNPILQDAFYHIKCIQNMIDNVEALEKELVSSTTTISFPFFNEEQNKELQILIQNFMVSQKIRMQDELSELLYNTKYTEDDVHNRKEMIIEQVEEIKKNTDDSISTAKGRKHNSLNEEEKKKLFKYLKTHTQEDASKKFNVSKATIGRYIATSKTQQNPDLENNKEQALKLYKEKGIKAVVKEFHKDYYTVKAFLEKEGVYVTKRSKNKEG